MIGYGQAIFLGLVQGVSELFPISSLGHSIIISGLAGWTSPKAADAMLTFLVATHLATALVLILFFGREWLAIIAGFFRSLVRAKIETATERVAWLLVLATIPAGLLGLLLQKKLTALFVSPRLVSLVLIANGVVLLLTEAWARRRHVVKHTMSALPWSKAFFVGLAQILALIPGFSRTGMTMAGSLGSGLDREHALEFSFLLSGPIILAAAVLKLPTLASTAERSLLGPAIIGAIVAVIASWFSAKFLTRYFKKSTRNLLPFAIYCLVAGFIAFILL